MKIIKYFINMQKDFSIKIGFKNFRLTQKGRQNLHRKKTKFI